jgi:hypothetical protein
MNTNSKLQLNNKQLVILHALYKFRFATEQLLALSQGTKRRSMHERLRILVDRGYPSRRYDGTYSLAGKPAMYCLTIKAVAVLKNKPKDFDHQVLRNIRKDESASDRFASHCINVFAVYCRLRELHGETFKFFTSSDMKQMEDLPSPLPDAYIRFSDGENGEPIHYLMDCYDDTFPQFVIRKRIARFVDHADDGAWTITESYPVALLVSTNNELQKKVGSWVNKAYEDRWTNELRIVTATIETLPNLRQDRLAHPAP